MIGKQRNPTLTAFRMTKSKKPNLTKTLSTARRLVGEKGLLIILIQPRENI